MSVSELVSVCAKVHYNIREGKYISQRFLYNSYTELFKAFFVLRQSV